VCPFYAFRGPGTKQQAKGVCNATSERGGGGCGGGGRKGIEGEKVEKRQQQTNNTRSKMTPVGFEPTHPEIVELESTALDHSAKVSWEHRYQATSETAVERIRVEQLCGATETDRQRARGGVGLSTGMLSLLDFDGIDVFYH
jgi:hypothetical protein